MSVSSPVNGVYQREWPLNSATQQGSTHIIPFHMWYNILCVLIIIKLFSPISSNIKVSISCVVVCCHGYREALTNQMSSRSDALDVKLLLYAIQKTTSFEKTLTQRFARSLYMEEVRNW